MAQPWYLDNIWQGFKWNTTTTSAHSGEDIGMPCGTPITAPVSGTVLTAGPQRWGGQVDILVPPGGLPAPYSPSAPHVVSFLHLSREDVRPGPVTAGQQIGVSGAPPPGFGSGCHTHVEVTYGPTPPYTGYNPWYPTATSHPVSPGPLLALLGNSAANSQQNGGVTIPQGTTLAYGGSPSYGGGSPNLPNNTNSGGPTSTPGQHCWNFSIGPVQGPQFCVSQTVYEWLTQPIRVIKLLAGILLMSAGFVLFALPTSLQVAGVVSGQPELAMTGTLLKGKRGGRSTARARGIRMVKQGFSSKPRKPAPGAGAPPAPSAPAQAPPKRKQKQAAPAPGAPAPAAPVRAAGAVP